MKLGKCPNCNLQSTKQMFTKQVIDGVIQTFICCDKCPKPKVVKKNSFPAIVTSKTRANRGYQGVFSRVKENTKEEIQRNRELVKQAPVRRDTVESRFKDSIDKERLTVGFATDIDGQAPMNFVSKKFDKKFGNNNWKIVKQDQVNITAEKL